jgi:adenosylmethionine-8-amino-7-oxononanoate aminotransferase
MSYKQIFPFSVNEPQPTNVKKIDRMTEYGFIDSGKEIIDLGLGSSGCFPLGFNRTDLLDNITSKLRDAPFCQSDFTTTNLYVTECSQKLYDISGGYRSLFSLSGSDAIEGAVKLVKMYHNNKKSNKTEIIGFLGSYHGSTYMSASISGATYMTDTFGKHPDCKLVEIPRYPGSGCRNEAATIEEAEANNIQILKKIITDKTAAIFVESVSWEAGVWVSTNNWWKQLRELCTENDVLLVIDDIAFCAGKTGTIFGWEPLGIQPDIFCIGKGITGGYFPASATLCNDKVYQETAPQMLLHGFSYSFPMGGIIGILEYLKILEEEQVLEKHEQVIADMKSKVVQPLIDDGLVKDSRNYGVCFKLIPGFDTGAFSEKDDLLYQFNMHMGLWNSHQSGILVLIPLNASDTYFTMLKDRLSACLTYLRDNS